MADDAPFLPGLSPIAGKPVHVTFDAGRLTSDGGVLVLAEVERRLGVAERLARCLEDPRAPERVQHGLAEMIRFRALLIAAGYEDANDCDACGPTRPSRWRSARGWLPRATSGGRPGAPRAEAHEAGRSCSACFDDRRLWLLHTLAVGAQDLVWCDAHFDTIRLAANQVLLARIADG